jgi:hypothetical protein
MVIENIDGDKNGEWKNENNRLRFYFQRVSGTRQVQREREPGRFMEIQNPEHYKGELGVQGNSQQIGGTKLFFVNGEVDRCDGNLVTIFFFERIGNTNLYIGSYPMEDYDFKRLADEGVKSILNLQTHA